jgi:hypothetical protein
VAAIDRARRRKQQVKELFRSNDVVLLSFVEALLRDAEIEHTVVDGNMSIIEGSVGILPRRMLVTQDQWEQARRILKDAGLADVTGHARDPV